MFINSTYSTANHSYDNQQFQKKVWNTESKKIAHINSKNISHQMVNNNNQNQCTNSDFKKLGKQRYRELIERQREINNALRSEIEEEKNKHDQRMKQVKQHLDVLSKQYDGYEKELIDLQRRISQYEL